MVDVIRRWKYLLVTIYTILYKKKHLKKTECLVLDPVDETNYFIIKNDGDFKWQVNDHFHDVMNKDDYILYLDPHNIRYTQTSISSMFAIFILSH